MQFMIKMDLFKRKKKKTELEKELEEGYKAKAKLNLKISDDFKHVDGENIE